MYKKNAWEQYDEAELAKVEAFAAKYKAYLDAGKTERECVTEAVKLAEAAGFIDLDKVIREGGKLEAGARGCLCNGVRRYLFHGQKLGPPRLFLL